MEQQTRSAIKLIEALTERAKELTCLYAIEEFLKDPGRDIDEVCRGIVEAIPPGWQYSEVCTARISLYGEAYHPDALEETPWKLSADIVEHDEVVGTLDVFYSETVTAADSGPFLLEEEKLIQTIADRVSHFLVYKRMSHLVSEWQSAGGNSTENQKGDWEAVLDLLQQTDHALFLRIASKMLNHLCWSGIREAEEVRERVSPAALDATDTIAKDVRPARPNQLAGFTAEVTVEVFSLADQHLSGGEILSRIQMWIQEDRLSALVQAVHCHLPLSEVADALRRHSSATHEEPDAQYPITRGLKVALIRRILSDQLKYINLAKSYVEIADIYQLLQKVVFGPESRGKLGGKSAGLFLAAQVLRKAQEPSGILAGIEVPRTWYISSDMMRIFMHFNNIDEIIEQKYKEVERVRQEYPHVVQTFGQCSFPPEMEKGLSMALDDLGDNPLIVRSSSLLEDCVGSAFLGKYESIFLANQGTKQRRLAELKRAVARVYASIFAPEGIEFRAERGLLDFSEEMGIMIQEVVGTRVGRRYLPAFAGIALSRNDFRWSPKIRREDGVVRIVPGLGTRAVKRIADDYPILIAPGQPGLAVNRTVEEVLRYAPKKVDAIDLDTGRVEEVEFADILRESGEGSSLFDQLVSVHANGELHPIEQGALDLERDELVVTCDGLISRSPFVAQIHTLLQHLEEKLGTPVQVEFASDGRQLYLLQCRPQVYACDAAPAPIPKDILPDKVIFSIARNLSNGWVSDITHIVYIDPEGYGALRDEEDYRAVDEVTGLLNDFLPKRQFVLIRPGRLVEGLKGESCSDYAHISNAAALVEMLPSGGNGEPELSFAAHFFQDLIASRIHYLPIDLQDEARGLNRRFLRGARNLLSELLPEHAHLSGAVRVIDIPKSADGMLMQILMNAELDTAVGILTKPGVELGLPQTIQPASDGRQESYWRWRAGMAEHIALMLDADLYGVVEFYLFGSTKNGTAGPGSDIDILIHFRGNPEQRRELMMWLEGWSLCLDEINYLQTGYRSGGLLDVHLVTDKDIANKTSYAMKIGAVTDAARPLEMKCPDNAARTR